MDEEMPWRDTPANRVRWGRLQNSYAFLRHQQARFGFLKCSYCGLSPLMIVHWSDRSRQDHPRKATVDHVIPISRGGQDYFHNMVVSCAPCNRRKGSNLPDSTPHAWTHHGDTDEPDETGGPCSGILGILFVLFIFFIIASGGR